MYSLDRLIKVKVKRVLFQIHEQFDLSPGRAMDIYNLLMQDAQSAMISGSPSAKYAFLDFMRSLISSGSSGSHAIAEALLSQQVLVRSVVSCLVSEDAGLKRRTVNLLNGLFQYPAAQWIKDHLVELLQNRLQEFESYSPRSSFEKFDHSQQVRGLRRKVRDLCEKMIRFQLDKSDWKEFIGLMRGCEPKSVSKLASAGSRLRARALGNEGRSNSEGHSLQRQWNSSRS
jgi:hypothetical protein